MYQIGVDIGGTNIKVGLVNETMELVQTCSVRFPHDGARSVVKTIEEAVDFLLRQQAIARKDVESVGIVVPGSIDQTGERVIDAYNLGFHDVPLKALKLKDSVLVASIIRRGKCRVPSGNDAIELGDRVVVVTTNHGMHELKDILK